MLPVFMGIAARRNPLFYARCGAKDFFDKLNAEGSVIRSLLLFSVYFFVFSVFSRRPNSSFPPT